MKDPLDPLASAWVAAASSAPLDAALARDIQATLLTSLLAILLSVPIGLVAGLAVFHAGRLRATSELGLDFLRSIPMTAFVPFFMVAFGHRDTALAAGTFSSSLLICLGTLQGLKSRNVTRSGVARVLGVSGLRRLALVELPEGVDQIFVGLRAGVSLALVLVIVTEMTIGTQHGLGRAIADVGSSGFTAGAVCAFLASGVLGYSYNASLLALERRIVHWRGL